MRGPRAGGGPCTSNLTLSGGSHHTSLPFGHEIKMPLKNPFTAKHEIGIALLCIDALWKGNLRHPLNVLSYHSLALSFLFFQPFFFHWVSFVFEVRVLKKKKKGNTYGNMFQIWWYKWELAINDVVLISHMESDYQGSSRRRRGTQSLGCAWRACGRLLGPGTRGLAPQLWELLKIL